MSPSSQRDAMRAVLVPAALLLACSLATGCPQKRVEAPEPTQPPALVVLIVVDQLPSWSFERDLPTLDGGFARLAREGLYYPNARFPYIATYTAAGHAALATGAAPNVSGILGNAWYRADGSLQTATSDPSYPLFSVESNLPMTEKDGTKPPGASTRNLRVRGISDSLVAAGTGAKSVSVGLKERATLLMLGKRATVAAFYKASLSGITTSTFYAKDEMPEWIARFNRDQPVQSRFDFVWKASDAAALRKHTGIDDDSPGEGGPYGIGATFPHEFKTGPSSARAILSTPAATAMVFDLAEAAIEGESLGARGVTDYLGITVSSHDYAGHMWGQESWERYELLRDLDRRLGEFMSNLDKRYGADGYAIVLTSDHGAVPLVEQSLRKGHRARRISFESLTARAQDAAETVLGPGKWFVGSAATGVAASPALRAKPAKERRRALAAAAQAVAAMPGVDDVMVVSDVSGNCERRTEPVKSICRSLTDESGELVVIPSRYSLIAGERYTRGTGHGTGSPECQVVPLFVRAPGVAPKVHNGSVSMLRVAPTLAELLGVAPPPAAKEPSLLP